jgi:cell division protein FtsQ
MKSWVKISLWVLLTTGVVITLVLTNGKREDELLPEPEIKISAGENPFLTKEELTGMLRRKQLLFDNQLQKELKAVEIETFVNDISHVKKANVYTLLDGNWGIDVVLRNPIVRVFNKYGESFYLDDEGLMMRTTPNFTARVVVASGEITGKIGGENPADIINNDSLISIRNLDDIYHISNYVCNDPLFSSLIGQIFIEEDGEITLTPIVGEHIIIFGDANSKVEVEEKFEKLRIFYKNAMPYEGWDAHTTISVKYDGQIVGKKKKTE